MNGKEFRKREGFNLGFSGKPSLDLLNIGSVGYGVLSKNVVFNTCTKHGGRTIDGVSIGITKYKSLPCEVA